MILTQKEELKKRNNNPYSEPLSKTSKKLAKCKFEKNVYEAKRDNWQHYVFSIGP